MRRARVAGFCLTVLGLVVLTASCTSGGSTQTAPPQQSSSASTMEASPAQPPSSAPSSGSIARATPFTVSTHCGVESARINGRWWQAAPPLYNKSRISPPAGWGDPFQKGTLTVESADRAIFEALGQQVVFVPAPNNEPVRICD